MSTSSSGTPVVELAPRIVVFGVGGAGGNAINNMIESKLAGVEFVAANTDAQALARSLAENRIQLGARVTQGLGAGAKPEVGEASAEDAGEEVRRAVKGANMVFVTAGMGGGTGTGAAPVIARIAREEGALTVAVVTRPFDFEGSKRARVAEEGTRRLETEVDTLIAIPNQNLFRIANERTTIKEAFALADEVLHSGVRGITDLMTRPGLINLDFADVRTVMNEMGKAMMGTGEAIGERRAIEAAHAAISNPLLDDVTLRGAKAVLINITGGYDMTLFEVDEAANEIRAEVDPEAEIIVGSAFDELIGNAIRVSVVATGIDPNRTAAAERARPADRARSFARGGYPATPAPPPPPTPAAAPVATAARAAQSFGAGLLRSGAAAAKDAGAAAASGASSAAGAVGAAAGAAGSAIGAPFTPAPRPASLSPDPLPEPADHDRYEPETEDSDRWAEPRARDVEPTEPTPRSAPERAADRIADRFDRTPARSPGSAAPSRVSAPEEKPKLFGLFGGRRPRPVEEPAPEPAPRRVTPTGRPATTPVDGVDEEDEEGLEIPAFLRRGGNGLRN